jgi:two-component system sensor histidine kinase AlgZ
VVALVPVFVAYAMVAVAASWVKLREHALLLAAAEARARQAALAARVRPHFLFNALNCIEELAAADPSAARLAVGRLARLLRAVLEASASPKARLSDEVRLVDDYLGIERIRFGARFSYSLDVADDVGHAEIPSTILLTLAENAVKHGIEAVAGDATIVLRARRAGSTIVLVLESPAPRERSSRAEHGTGYGLSDAKERLELAYAGRASLTLRIIDGTAHVELTLPG